MILMVTNGTTDDEFYNLYSYPSLSLVLFVILSYSQNKTQNKILFDKSYKST